MKNMKPVASQDRPKLIAVSVGIAVALGFVARNLVGTGILANSHGPQPIAISATGDVAALPSPAEAAAAIPRQPATAGAAGKPAGFGNVGPLPLNDPFQPVTPIKTTRTPAAPAPTAAPPAAAPAQRPAAPPPALGSGAHTANRTLPPAHPAARPAEGGAAGPGPVLQHPNPSPEAPAVLTGTVGRGAAAVATFRVGEETVFAGPHDRVAGWEVVRIELGRVWLSRQHSRQRVRVGNSLFLSASE